MQTDGETDWQTDGETDLQTDGQTDWQTDRQIGRQIDIWTDRQTDWLTTQLFISFLESDFRRHQKFVVLALNLWNDVRPRTLLGSRLWSFQPLTFFTRVFSLGSSLFWTNPGGLQPPFEQGINRNRRHSAKIGQIHQSSRRQKPTQECKEGLWKHWTQIRPRRLCNFDSW